MKRPLGMLVALVLLAGCRGSGTSGNAVDPFFGRTRIQPPGTGAVGVRPQGTALPTAQVGQPFRTPYSYTPGGAIVTPGPVSVSAPNSSPPPAAVLPSWTAPSTRPAMPGPSLNAPATSYAPPADPSYAASVPGDQIAIPASARTVTDPPCPITSSGSVAVNTSAPSSATAATSLVSPQRQPAASSIYAGNRLASRTTTQVLEPASRPTGATPSNAPVPMDATQIPHDGGASSLR